MGNTNSSNNLKGKQHIVAISNKLETIMSSYITSQSFKELLNLENKTYCDKLYVLTASMLKNNFDEREIMYLNRRVAKKESTFYTSIDKDFYSYDRRNVDKENICKSISKFYVKIAHLYSAILLTLNPTYYYIDDNKRIQKVPLKHKHLVPQKYRKRLKIKTFDLCSSKLNKLHVDSKNRLSNTYCDKSNTQLINEPGIFELQRLYYDIYDDSNGLYREMSSETLVEYKKDLLDFYTAITGNTVLPKKILTFSDIKLPDFSGTSMCMLEKSFFKKKILIDKNSSLFKKLGYHIRSVKNETFTLRNKLIDILDKIFIINSSKDVILHPDLTSVKLDNMIKNARKIISTMYISCEKNAGITLKIYQAIVKEQNNKLIKRKLKNLDRELQKTIAEQ